MVNPGSNWAIAVACFFINIFVLGPPRLYPLLFVEFLIRFNPDRSVSVFPFMLFFMFSFGSGPFIGYFGQRFGLHRVIFSGCLLSVIGVALCSFAEDIVVVTIFWGVCYGLGMGIEYALLPAVLNLNFRKNQTKANGFAMAGISLGSVIFPPLFEVLLRIYGLPGTFLIISAIVMNGIPACMILKTRDISVLAANESSKGSNNPESILIPKYRVETRYISGLKSTNGETSKEQLSEGCESIMQESPDISLQSFGQCDIIVANSPTTFTKDISRKEQKYVSEDNVMQRAPNTLMKVTSATNLRDGKEKKDLSSACSESPIAKDTDFSLKYVTKPVAEQQAFMGSLRVFMDPVFFVIGITQSFFLYIIVVVTAILIDFMRDKGMPSSHETIFLVCYLLVDMAGRIIVGWVIDSGYMTLTKYTALCGVFTGLALVASAQVTNYTIVIGIMNILSILTASTYVVLPGIIHKFIEPDYRTMALASRSLLFLPLNLTSSSLIGFFRDKLGSYDGIFYILSAISFLCCGFCFLIPPLARRRDYNKNKLLQHTETHNLTLPETELKGL